MKKTAIISLSGGVDSTTLLTFLLANQYEILPVCFKYPSKHNKQERKAAKKIALYYGIELLEIKISSFMSHFHSALLKGKGKIPESHYLDENMKKTIIPCRNLIFISILSGIAKSQGIDEVALGVHQGDYFIYPDCRPKFIEAVKASIRLATDEEVVLSTPFLHYPKSEIIKIGLKLQAPYFLTWTCYKGGRLHCGKCGACVERLEAFKENGTDDPVKYKEN